MGKKWSEDRVLRVWNSDTGRVDETSSSVGSFRAPVALNRLNNGLHCFRIPIISAFRFWRVAGLLCRRANFRAELSVGATRRCKSVTVAHGSLLCQPTTTTTTTTTNALKLHASRIHRCNSRETVADVAPWITRKAFLSTYHPLFHLTQEKLRNLTFVEGKTGK